MRTGVPEELQHLDLARGNRGRLSRHDARVVDAFLPQCGPVGVAADAVGRRRGDRRGDRRQQRIVRAAVARDFLDGFRAVFVHAGDCRRQVGCRLGRLLAERRRRGGAALGAGAVAGAVAGGARSRRIPACRRPSAASARQASSRDIAKPHVSECPCRYEARLRMSSGDRRLAMVCMMPFGPGRAGARRVVIQLLRHVAPIAGRAAPEISPAHCRGRSGRGRPCRPECRAPDRRRDRAFRPPASRRGPLPSPVLVRLSKYAPKSAMSSGVKIARIRHHDRDCCACRP